MRLSLQYEGKAFSVYAIELDSGRCPAVDYLEQLRRTNPALGMKQDLVREAGNGG